MTKNEVLQQIYGLSVGGNFNHETGWSFSKFKSYIAEKFSDENRKSIIMEIELPDGWWYMSIVRMKIKSNKYNFWDYYIPDTKEHNDELHKLVVEEYDAKGKSIYDI